MKVQIKSSVQAFKGQEAARTQAVNALANGLLTRAKALRARGVSIDYVDYIEKNLFIINEADALIPFHLNQIQQLHYRRKKEAEAAGKPKKFLVLKYRRGGFTTLEQGLSYSMMATRPNTECLTLAQDAESTQRIFKMVRLMHLMNPNAPKESGDSKREISYSTLNSSYYIHTAGSKSVARGQRLARMHGSEVAFWELPPDDIQNLVAGLSEAARMGEMVLESTANGAKGWFYHTFSEAMRGSNDWTPLFYPWYMDAANYIVPSEEDSEKILDTLDDEEALLVNTHGCTIGQLLWRRLKRFSLKKLFAQEYPSHWQEAFIVRGTTFFDPETLKWHAARCSTPLEDSQTGLTVWKKPEPGCTYVMGADCSEGVDMGDFSYAGVLNKATGEQVARMQMRCRPEVFGRKLVQLAKHYNKATIGVERNNHGHSVLNTILNVEKYSHIYYAKELLKTANGTVHSRKAGWLTNGSTRPVLLDDINAALEEKLILVNDAVFLEQCKVFVDRGGRYEAAQGEHDDGIIAWGIAWQVKKNTKKGLILT